MMKLSTKGRYGARLMLDLALHYNEGPILLKNIAEREDLSVGYLEHILPLLKVAGLIISRRGAHGGYTLSKAPSEITLKDVIQAVEGPLTPVECINSPSVCQKVESCATREVWEKLGESISQTLGSVTLKDMIEMHEEKRKNFI